MLYMGLFLLSGLFYISSAASLQRKQIDTNCYNDDIVFTWLDWNRYTWAGCNSTLWNPPRDFGVWITNTLWKCQSWSTVTTPNIYYSYLTKEIDIGWSCKMDNIMWKMYSWTYLSNNCKAVSWNNFIWTNNTNCACPDWWHVPTTNELQLAINYYSRYSNSEYIWRWWSATTSWLAMQFKLPLAWYWDWVNFGTRWQAWFYWSSNFSTRPYYLHVIGQWFYYYLWTDYASRIRLINTTYSESSEFSVRCIKDQWIEPLFFTDNFYTLSGDKYIWTRSFSLENIFDAKWTSTIWVNLIMQSNDSKVNVGIWSWTKFLKSDWITNYTWILNTPELLSTWSANISWIVALARIWNIWESIKLKNSLWESVFATIRIPVQLINLWTNVFVKYSNDWINWYDHSTSIVVDIWWETYVEFTTDHFTDFAIWESTWSFTINNDDASTTSQNVILNISAPWAQFMRFSNDWSSWSTWEAYATTKSRTLSVWYGTKTVYAEFDTDWNYIADVSTSDTISYSQTPWTVEWNLSLEILTWTSECVYWTSLYLWSQNIKLNEAYSFTWTFSWERFCADYKWYTEWWALTIQLSWHIKNINWSIISWTNLLLSHDTPVSQWDSACTWWIWIPTEIYTNPYTIFDKMPWVDKICRVSTNNIWLQINVPANQAPWDYIGTLVINIPNFY